MLHILLIDDCYPINTRNQKILHSLAQHYGEDARLTVVTWDRANGYTQSKDGYHVYQKSSAYGNKTRKLLNLWGYRNFCHDTIRRLKPDVIIASHWNNLMMVPTLDRQRQMLIYENLDVPTEAYILRKVTTWIEHWHMRRVDLTIHASRFFSRLYSSHHKQLVLENKPVFPVPSPKTELVHQPIRIAFIGLLRYRDILSLLIEAIRNDSRFELYFHGEGHAMSYLQQYAKGAKNVFFTGRYAYDDIARFYEQTDVVWAAYPNRDFNVKYAISNKFHESLAFATPAVYADQTCLGEFVEEQHIGMTVNPYSIESIHKLLERIYNQPKELEQMSNDMRRFAQTQTTWDEDFTQVISAINVFSNKN